MPKPSVEFFTIDEKSIIDSAALEEVAKNAQAEDPHLFPVTRDTLLNKYMRGKAVLGFCGKFLIFFGYVYLDSDGHRMLGTIWTHQDFHGHNVPQRAHSWLRDRGVQ